MLENVAAFTVPVTLGIASLIMLFKKNSVKAFSEGAFNGMKDCFGLMPSLLLIMCGVNAFFSSGLCDLICNAVNPIFEFFKIPEEISPAVVLRPFSGGAVNAVADKLFEKNGPDGSTAKILCLFMGTTDTALYTLGMYFGAINVKRTRYAIPASVAVFLFSVVFCAFVGNFVYG